MNAYIYRIDLGDYFYYGSTTRPERREKEHLYHLKKENHTNRFMRMVFQKHQDYRFMIVATVIRFSDTMRVEQKFLDRYIDDPKCMNVARKADKPPAAWGRTPSRETRKKLSERHSGKNHHNWGGRISDETKKKMSKSSGQRVIVTDKKTGDRAEYRSIRHVAKEFNTSPPTIRRWCLDGISDSPHPNLKFEYCQNSKNPKPTPVQKKVVVIDTRTNETHFYESAKSASVEIGVSYHAMTNWCKGETKSRLFPDLVFRYAEP